MAQSYTGDNFYSARGFGGPQSQKFFCDVCKVDCIGTQSYQAHVAGQKHKKKLTAAELTKTSTVATGTVTVSGAGSGGVGSSVGSVVGGGAQALFCELCNVSCSGQEVMRTHVNGARHKKVIAAMKARGLQVPKQYEQQSPDGAVSSQTAVTSKPQIKFTASQKSDCTPMQTDSSPETDSADAAAAAAAAAAALDGGTEQKLFGPEYIETLTTDQGSVVSYHCKLCECSFTDPAARLQHLSGRRHLLMYKKKVDSSLAVPGRGPPARVSRVREMKEQRQQSREQHWRRMDVMAGQMDEQAQWLQWPHGRNTQHWYRRPWTYGSQRRLTAADHYVMRKHDAILLKQADLSSLEQVVSLCEQTLATVSQQLTDELAATQGTAATDADGDKATSQTGPETAAVTGSSSEASVSGAGAEETGGESGAGTETAEKRSDEKRVLVGMVRVGLFAQRMLLDGDVVAELVVICADKPTTTLLRRIATLMANDISKATPAEEAKYAVAMDCDETSIVVYQNESPHWTVTINLTSPAMRQQADEVPVSSVEPAEDVLDRQECLVALAAIRRIKWFHARCQSLMWAPLVNRVLRDLRRREVAWSHLTDWAQVLLVEKCICYIGYYAGPAEVLRSVCECIGSGLLLPDGPGLLDPCEKDSVDAAANLTVQQREDLTLAAQTAVRLIVWRQTHKVLGMDELSSKELFFRSRPRTDDSAAAGADVDDGDDDKQNGQVDDTTAQRDAELESKKPKLDKTSSSDAPPAAASAAAASSSAVQ